jgi:predicted ThiF/HesA family dinucleotide-utilizing enzyme
MQMKIANTTHLKNNLTMLHHHISVVLISGPITTAITALLLHGCHQRSGPTASTAIVQLLPFI